MEKDFDAWNEQKKKLENQKEPYFREGEVWWLSLGVNIGKEMDGKGKWYRRPVLIVKKFNQHGCLVVPLSKIEKKHAYIVPVGMVDGIDAYSNLSQTRSLSAKRLERPIHILDGIIFNEVKKIAREVLFPDDSQINPPVYGREQDGLLEPKRRLDYGTMREKCTQYFEEMISEYQACYNYFMNIILYTKTGCPWCAGVLELFEEKGVKFEEREVTGNKDYFDELVKKSGQTKTPTMDLDGEIFADSDREAIEKILTEKNYPGF
jgi:mRNA interferase MazF